MKKHLGFVLVFLLLIPSLAFAIDLSNVKFGGQVRVRGYVLENPFDFQSDGAFGPFDADWDNYSVFRLKASVFTSIDVGDNVTGYVKLTNQNYGANAMGLQRALSLGSYQTAWEWLPSCVGLWSVLAEKCFQESSR